MKSIIICLALSLVLLTLCNADITAVDIILGQHTSCRSGYNKIFVDLNKGAGGDYIYLCYSTSTAVSSSPITGLTVVAGGSSSVTCPSGYSKISIDLNKGAGGEYIYLCYTKNSGPTSIKNVNVLASDGSSVRVPQGWTCINRDLNKGAGGKYIYLIYNTGRNLLTLVNP